jgi:hypothetical protein
MPGRSSGQFPHLFPASVAIGYGLDGLTGARRAVGVWAVLGLLAVYFAGAQLAGRAAGFAASGLLSLHVIPTWFARYPNAEVVMLACLFTGLLALARAHGTGGRAFGPLAGVLLGLLLFLRVDAALAVVAALAGLALLMAAGGRWVPGFLPVLIVLGATAVWYLLGPLRAYAELPIQYLTHNVWWWQQLGFLLAIAAAVWAVALVRRHPALSSRVDAHAPTALAAVLVAAAIYALYFREPGGRLASHDAYALRHFVAFYLSLPALIAALAGFVLIARDRFWRSPALLVTLAAFSLFFFYKIRIVPEHFWAARRFLPMILPGALLCLSAAAMWGVRQTGARRYVSTAIGVAFLVLLAGQYARASRPVAGHVEYAGIIPHLSSWPPVSTTTTSCSSSRAMRVPTPTSSGCRSPTSTRVTCWCWRPRGPSATRLARSSSGPGRAIAPCTFSAGAARTSCRGTGPPGAWPARASRCRSTSRCRTPIPRRPAERVRLRAVRAAARRGDARDGLRPRCRHSTTICTWSGSTPRSTQTDARCAGRSASRSSRSR